MEGRVLALRETRESIRIVHKSLRQKASKQGTRLQPQTILEFPTYVIVFTTFPEAELSVAEILQGYRTRWHVELVFKRFRSPARFPIAPHRAALLLRPHA